MADEPLDREALLKRIEEDWEPRFVFFWGHAAQPDAPVGKSCLSQWFPASFTITGAVYSTAEHYMMSRKALLFGDHGAAARIMSSAHPGEAKELGRHVRGFDEDAGKLTAFELSPTAAKPSSRKIPDCSHSCLPPGTEFSWKLAPRTPSGVSAYRTRPRTRGTPAGGAGSTYLASLLCTPGRDSSRNNRELSNRFASSRALELPRRFPPRLRFRPPRFARRQCGERRVAPSLRGAWAKLPGRTVEHREIALPSAAVRFR
jgi:hypothetical protein